MPSPSRRPRIPPVAVANFLIVALAGAIAALAGLVADDLFPKAPGGWTPLRAIVLVVFLALLYAAIRHRGRVHETTGTIFHVQVLDERMPDLSDKARDTANQGRMAIRSITRWVDLVHCTNVDGVAELVDVATTVGDILEAQINQDSPDTGYSIAPVMPWPLAVAIGTELPLPGRLRLLELQPNVQEPTNVVHLERDQAGAVIEVPLPIADPTADGRHGVWIALTAASADLAPDRWSQWGVTDGVRLGPGPALPSPGARLRDDEMTGLAAGLAIKLTEIRRKQESRELVVVAMMPKVVALALGWHLAQQQTRFFAGTHLLHYDRPTDSFLPLRVKEAQPARRPGAADA